MRTHAWCSLPEPALSMIHHPSQPFLYIALRSGTIVRVSSIYGGARRLVEPLMPRQLHDGSIPFVHTIEHVANSPSLAHHIPHDINNGEKEPTVSACPNLTTAKGDGSEFTWISGMSFSPCGRSLYIMEQTTATLYQFSISTGMA
jgi:hypothetical protein